MSLLIFKCTKQSHVVYSHLQSKPQIVHKYVSGCEICLRKVPRQPRRKHKTEPHMSHSKNLQSLTMSYHFGYAKAYAMLMRVGSFLTRSKLRKPLREVLTRPYASVGFVYAKHVMTRPLQKYKGFFRSAHVKTVTSYQYHNHPRMTFL